MRLSLSVPMSTGLSLTMTVAMRYADFPFALLRALMVCPLARLHQIARLACTPCGNHPSKPRPSRAVPALLACRPGCGPRFSWGRSRGPAARPPRTARSSRGQHRGAPSEAGKSPASLLPRPASARSSPGTHRRSRRSTSGEADRPCRLPRPAGGPTTRAAVRRRRPRWRLRPGSCATCVPSSLSRLDLIRRILLAGLEQVRPEEFDRIADAEQLVLVLAAAEVDGHHF